MAQAKDIKEKVLWVIDSKENEKQGGGSDLRVIQWIIDGKPTKPGLEKRDWYLDDEGNRKNGKAKAFNSYDLVKVITNLKRIASLMEMKIDHLDEALQLAQSQADPSKTESREPVASGAPPSQSF
jgi:hypothetical protein